MSIFAEIDRALHEERRHLYRPIKAGAIVLTVEATDEFEAEIHRQMVNFVVSIPNATRMSYRYKGLIVATTQDEQAPRVSVFLKDRE